MDYEGERSGVSAGSVIFGAAIVAMLVIVGAGAFWWQGVQRERRTSPEAVATMLVEDRDDGARLFQAMKETHPKDFATLTRQLSAQLRKGKTWPELIPEGRKFLRDMSTRNAPLIAQAPHAEMTEFRRAQMDLLQAMQQDNVLLCARYVMVGDVDGDQLSRNARPLLLDASISQWRAAAAGRDRPAKRAIPDSPSQADSIALVEAMRKEGMSETDLRAFTTDGGMARAPQWQQCAIGVYLWNAIDALPDAQADRIAAMLIQEATGAAD